MNWLFGTLAYFRKIAKSRTRHALSRRLPSLETLEDRAVPAALSIPQLSSLIHSSNMVQDATVNATNGTFDVWYNDNHALALGVRQVNVVSGKSTTTTNYPIAPLTSDPGSAVDPALGTTATNGNQAGTDALGRPIAPSLFITDITKKPNSTSGDWANGGTAIGPDAVFGTWKGVVKTVTKKTSSVTWTEDADPKQNGWNLGPGADPVPVGLTNNGYGAEISWNLNDLAKEGLLKAGHTYRFNVMVHEGNQNGTGGRVGHVVYDYSYPGPTTPPANQPATLSGFALVDNGSGNLTAVSGVMLTLTGTTASGQQVTSQSVTTGTDGSYSFGNLQPGTYTVTATTIPPNYNWEEASVGTVNGTPNDGTPSGQGIGNISLSSGAAGTNYNFIVTPGVPIS